MAQETGSNKFVGIGRKHFVAGQLLTHEAVVRLIFVERAHDPVTVSPGLRALRVAVEAVAFGVTCEVQPVSGPPFAVARRGEQTVDETRVGAGRVLRKKAFLFGERRGQAVQVELHTS